MTAPSDDPLVLLRAPFPDSEISHRPQAGNCYDCKQSSQKACDKHPKRSCNVCHGYHATSAIHLSYVGHAEVTDRLLSVDPEWNWEPVQWTDRGTPAMDGNGGMWIRLTVAGVTRLGYGDAPGKTGGNAVKEAIGDALRNAAMRFGVALDLWRKTERAQVDAAAVDPDLEPEGRIIGHGEVRVTREDWEARVGAASVVTDLDESKAQLAELWQLAGENAQMRAAVGAGIEHWKQRKAEADLEALRLSAEKQEAALQERAEPVPQAGPPPPPAGTGDDFRLWFTEAMDYAADRLDLPKLRELEKLARGRRAKDLGDLAKRNAELAAAELDERNGR